MVVTVVEAPSVGVSLVDCVSPTLVPDFVLIVVCVVLPRSVDVTDNHVTVDPLPVTWSKPDVVLTASTVVDDD